MKKGSTVAGRQSRNISRQQLTMGLDLGDRNSCYCVLDESGQVQLEQRVRTTAKGFHEAFGGMPHCRVALETGTHSPWISRLLSELGHEVIVAVARAKVPVQLKLIAGGPRTVAHVEVGALGPSFGVEEADVYIALALNRAESQVSSGENAGRKLDHVAVVRELRKIGVLKLAQPFSQDLPLDPQSTSNERLIAIVQERHQGKVLGVARLALSAGELAH